jgi:hypothetical protein
MRCLDDETIDALGCLFCSGSNDVKDVEVLIFARLNA